jgi:amino acid adenylation domain-containing protein
LRPFDLRHGPKLRATVWVGGGEVVLGLTMHHIAVDGWSLRRLLGDVAELYAAGVEGREPVLPVLSVQYLDYSAWLSSRSDALDAGLAYWRDALAGSLPVLDLPSDRPRPAVQGFRSGSIRFMLGEEMVDGVRGAARRAGVTTFVFLLASYVATLARWSGQDDFVVGTAAANRPRVELDPVVGMFVNTLPLRLGVDVDASFAELLARASVVVLDGFANEAVPFDRVVEVVNPPRDVSRSVLFQTMFVLNNMPIPDVQLPGIDVSVVPMPPGATEQDVSVSVVEDVDDAGVVVQFDADLFDESTIERLMSSWRRVLAVVAAQTDTIIGQIPLLDDDERELVLGDWSHGAVVPVAPGERVDQLIAAQARLRPDAVAVVGADGVLSYEQLMSEAARLAGALVDAGVGTGDRVGVAVERTPSMVVALLAVWRCGAAYVPLDPAFPDERLSFMIDDAALGVVLVSGDVLSGRVDTAGLQLIDVDAVDSAPLVDVAGGGDVAYVIYTSGSTGRPKGVEVEHVSLVSFVRSMVTEPGFGADDVMLAVTTLSFDISALELFVPLVAGGRAVLAGRDDVVDGRRLAALLGSSAATVMQATPSTWSMMFEAGWLGRASLRVLCGGEAMPVDLAERLLATCAEVWNMYGPTETTIWSTSWRLDGSVAGRVGVPVGRPIANTVCRVLDAGGGLAPVGVRGELCIGGLGVARGYLNRPELTAERFVTDPYGGDGGRLYRTGDLVRWLPDGNLDHLGRADSQVKVRGHRIELGEIEMALRAAPGVDDAVVVADGDARSGRLVAYVVAGDPASVASSELRGRLRRSLPEYMVPSLFVTLDALPMTPNRKVDRGRLPRPDAVSSVEHVPPRDDVERVVAGLVGDALGVDPVGVFDDFFELGGHSITATSVLAAVESAFGATIELRRFFARPTVADTSDALLADPASRARIERIAEARVRIASMSPEEVAQMLAARRAGVEHVTP